MAFSLDFIGIGSGKSGSTWLYENIVKHPEICDQNPKEINYFSKDYLFEKKSFDWYRKQFSECNNESIVGEFSIIYMYDLTSARRIKKHFPGVKVIAILRDPIERIYSDYFHSIRKNQFPKNKNFKEYISDEKRLEFGQYYKYLEPYVHEFGTESLKVILLEEVSSNPGPIMSDIYRLIGADDSFLPEDFDKKINEVAFYKLMIIENIMTVTSRVLNSMGFTLLIDKIKRMGLPALVRRINKKHSDKPEMLRSDREYLVSYFRGSNKILESRFGLPISKYWSI